jgi:hypothetical protein
MSTASLLDSMTAQMEASRRADLRRYGRLLLADDPADEKGVKELRLIIKRLEKSEGELAEDGKLIARARDRAQRAKQLPADYAQREREAQAAVAEYDAETAELLKQRRAEYFKRYNAVCDLHEQKRRADDARRDLQKLQRAHPDLLAFVGDDEQRDD